MRALPLCLLLLLALPQCGGAAAGTQPQTAENHASGAEDEDASEGSESAGEDDDTAVSRADDKPRGANCDDGSCSLCGSGICPSGWYCDENASGGAACSWLTECADKPSCGCITRVLGSACKCREEGGGLKVSCS